jgi:hypothetical protein
MLLKVWRGEERLWKVFWLLGVPLNVAWWTFYVDLWSRGLAPESFLLVSIWFWPVLLIALAVYAALYFAWCTVAWRCAGNVEHRVWTVVARLLVGVGLGSFATECLLILGAWAG